MNTTKLLNTMMIALLALTGCNRPGAGAPSASESPKSQTNELEAPVTVPAGVDNPIPATDINLGFKLISGPTYDVTNDSVTYQVEVSNTGKASLISAGKLPVNLGVVILGSDGTLETPPANQDFMRVPFPQPLATGQQVKLPITFQVAPTFGGTVLVDAVQEQVGWFRDYDKPVLTLGKFERCNGADNTLCLADGTVVPAVQ